MNINDYTVKDKSDNELIFDKVTSNLVRIKDRNNNKYSDSGIRTEKTVNGITTRYFVVDGRVTHETTGSNVIYYSYDDAGKLVSMYQAQLRFAKVPVTTRI